MVTTTSGYELVPTSTGYNVEVRVGRHRATKAIAPLEGGEWVVLGDRSQVRYPDAAAAAAQLLEQYEAHIAEVQR